MSGVLLWCCASAALAAGALALALGVARAPSTAAGGVMAAFIRVGVAVGALLPSRKPMRLRRVIEHQLARAGLRETCAPRDWIGCLAFCAVVAAGLASLLVAWRAWPAFCIPIAALLAPWVVHSWLTKLAERRASTLAKELPAGIDLLVLCLESGASLGAAMRIACDKQGAGPVQQLWAEVLAQMRAGQPRASALRRVMERLDLAPVTSLFTALIQAELRGMSLGGALRAQSAQCLADRFVRAERAALQAPVKLLLPLLTCIFPCTFIVIAVPIAARFVDMGGP